MRDSFYPRESASLTKEHFRTCFNIVSFEISNEEFEAIWNDLGGNEVGSIEVSVFYTKLTCWGDILNKNEEDDIEDINKDFFHVLISQTIGFG